MKQKDLNKEVDRLVDIVETLRSPGGCPWDREQDYYSLKSNILEEAYEVVEALETENLESLKEELGDLLLQVVFEAQIARESGDFDLTEVFSVISDKLIRRHPHVFGDKNLNSVSEVLTTWGKIKDEEKKEQGQDTLDSILDKVSRSQPALNQGYDLQSKAAEVGFDWDNVEDVVKKIEEELLEVKGAIKEDDKNKIKEEAGDLLFSIVNLTRFYEINPEVALLSTVLKFRKRFKYIEKQVEKTGCKLSELTLKELDSYWDQSKKEKDLREE